MAVKMRVKKETEPVQEKPKTPIYYRVSFTCTIHDANEFFDPSEEVIGSVDLLTDWPEFGGVDWTEERLTEYIQTVADTQFSGDIAVLIQEWGLIDWDEDVDFVVSLTPLHAQNVL